MSAWQRALTLAPPAEHSRKMKTSIRQSSENVEIDALVPGVQTTAGALNLTEETSKEKGAKLPAISGLASGEMFGNRVL